MLVSVRSILKIIFSKLIKLTSNEFKNIQQAPFSPRSIIFSKITIFHLKLKFL
jgi:hypothetical protein